MKATKKNPTKAQCIHTHLDPFTRGVIWGMHLGGMKREDMLPHVTKDDDSELCLNNLDRVTVHGINSRDAYLFSREGGEHVVHDSYPAVSPCPLTVNGGSH